jgi:hypothetical protein
MKCVNVVDGENIYSTYGIEQGWRVAQILLFVDTSLIPMQTEWKSISIAPPDRIIKQYKCVLWLMVLRRPFPKKKSLNQACSVFYAVRLTSAKFGVHASNVMFNARNEE